MKGVFLEQLTYYLKKLILPSTFVTIKCGAHGDWYYWIYPIPQPVRTFGRRWKRGFTLTLNFLAIRSFHA